MTMAVPKPRKLPKSPVTVIVLGDLLAEIMCKACAKRRTVVGRLHDATVDGKPGVVWVPVPGYDVGRKEQIEAGKSNSPGVHVSPLRGFSVQVVIDPQPEPDPDPDVLPSFEEWFGTGDDDLLPPDMAGWCERSHGARPTTYGVLRAAVARARAPGRRSHKPATGSV